MLSILSFWSSEAMNMFNANKAWFVLRCSYINRAVQALRKSKETARSIGTEKCVHFSNEEKKKKKKKKSRAKSDEKHHAQQ